MNIREQFPLGCRVAYMGTYYPTLIGTRGTVIGHSGQYAHVLFDGLETPMRCSNFIRRVEYTDKELADRYRALRKEAQDIATVLKEKGYTFNHRAGVRFFVKYTREEI